MIILPLIFIIMNNLQTYIGRYNDVVRNLGYTGDSVDVLVQLLANASYLSELEYASYTREASLDKSSLLNSKIQHCMDLMYSVFRGSCPRVVLKIQPTTNITLNPYDAIIESQKFTVYYLGYFKVTDSSGNWIIGGSKETSESTLTTSLRVGALSTTQTTVDTNIESSTCNTYDGLNIDEIYTTYGTSDNLIGSWINSSISMPKNSTVQIIYGLIAPKRTGENMIISHTFDSKNTYYVDLETENLSDDMYIQINGQNYTRTRNFSDHILDHSVFDLTLPGFGSRLYVANVFQDTVGRSSTDIAGVYSSTSLVARYFGYSTLDYYNESELNRLKLKGADYLAFVSQSKVLSLCGASESVSGLAFINEVPRDSVETIHYKANQDRYVNSILRSNSDIGTILEEMYPTVVKGTTYLFSASGSSSLTVYYIPINDGRLLTGSEISNFIQTRGSYYIDGDTITVEKGTKYTATFNISIELYKTDTTTDYDQSIGKEILVNGYEKKFDVSFDTSELKNIETLISKLSNVKKVTGIDVSYIGSERNEKTQEAVDE